MDEPDAAVQREQRRRGVVPDRDFRVFGGNYDLPDLPQPVPENVFDTLQRVPAHLEALLAAAAPLTSAGRDRPLDWDELMRLREVLLFAEAPRDYYREMAALARTASSPPHRAGGSAAGRGGSRRGPVIGRCFQCRLLSRLPLPRFLFQGPSTGLFGLRCFCRCCCFAHSPSGSPAPIGSLLSESTRAISGPPGAVFARP
jgi:hypothetical protein